MYINGTEKSISNESRNRKPGSLQEMNQTMYAADMTSRGKSHAKKNLIYLLTPFSLRHFFVNTLTHIHIYRFFIENSLSALDGTDSI